MFQEITAKFENITRKIFSSGRLTEKNLEEGIREVRKALLEADVNFGVVKAFIQRVKDKALGQEIIKSVKPAHQFIKIVQDELVQLMGPVDHSLNMAKKAPTIIMMVGLQGSGKTTTCGKLTKFLQQKGHRPLLVAADIQRPAAIEQLQVLGETLGVPVFSEPQLAPPQICAKAIPLAKTENCDIVILDTAGRLHIDDDLMKELQEVKKLTKPHNIFLVTDAMTGQDAAKSAKEFNERLEIDGVILTKLDGDARGGAALSIREVTGKTIKFVGIGEKLDNLSEFHPERMAHRILGMGDITTLVEQVQDQITEEEAEKLQEKMLKGSFTFDDFLKQFKMIKNMGSFRDILGMIPGIGSQLQGMDIDDKELNRTEAMILSMTPDERKRPEIINESRKERIAKGSGNSSHDVTMLIKQFKQMQKMMGKMSKKGGLGNLFGGGLGNLSDMMGGMGDMASMAQQMGMPNMGGGMALPSRKRNTKKKKKTNKDKKKK